jgi:hypothetical protein
LLENVGVEISPIRLIRRIKNGLEIPGLKDALIKILQDFHLQISLLEGCQTIMNGDSADLSLQLQKNQTNGFFLTGMSNCSLYDYELMGYSFSEINMPDMHADTSADTSVAHSAIPLSPRRACRMCGWR